MYPTVLAALDGSKNAEKVLPVVEPLLEAGKGEAVLLQVLPPGAEGPEAAAQAYLKEICSRLGKKEIQCCGEVVRGDPAVAIVRAAEERKGRPDGLHLARPGRVGAVGLRQRRPENPARLLRRAARGARAGNARLESKAGHRASRRRDASEAPLPHAAFLARAYGCPIELLHVAAESGVEADDSKLPHRHDRERQRMEARFDEIEKAEPGVKFVRTFKEGDPATRILERAEKESATVIVMGSHGRTGFSRWMYGSVSEKVLQAAKCPVLIARS